MEILWLVVGPIHMHASFSLIRQPKRIQLRQHKQLNLRFIYSKGWKKTRKRDSYFIWSLAFSYNQSTLPSISTNLAVPNRHHDCQPGYNPRRSSSKSSGLALYYPYAVLGLPHKTHLQDCCLGLEMVWVTGSKAHWPQWGFCLWGKLIGHLLCYNQLGSQCTWAWGQTVR